MSYIAKRTFSQWSTAPVESGTSDMKITPGMLEVGILLSVLYSVNVTGAGGAVRTRSLPIKRVSVLDGSNYLYSIKGSDLVSKAQIFEQTPIGALLVPASAAGVANYTALEAHVPIHFRQPHAGNGFLSDLPTWAYQNLTLRVEWGAITDLFTPNALTGAIAFTANGQTVTQLDLAGVPAMSAAQAIAVARQQLVTVDRYVEITQAAVAATELELQLVKTPGGPNIRALLITSELTSTGEPTDTIIDSVVLQQNNSTNVFQSVPWKSLKADNAKVFGLTMPTGCAVIDFAEDGDISRVFPAVSVDSLSLKFKTLAVAGTIRAHMMTLAKPVSI